MDFSKEKKITVSVKNSDFKSCSITCDYYMFENESCASCGLYNEPLYYGEANIPEKLDRVACCIEDFGVGEDVPPSCVWDEKIRRCRDYIDLLNRIENAPSKNLREMKVAKLRSLLCKYLILEDQYGFYCCGIIMEECRLFRGEECDDYVRE